MGPIDDDPILAETYEELQGIPHLRAARGMGAPPLASPESSCRTLLQAAEVALFNLADLYERAAKDMGTDRVGAAATKITWAWGFHRLLSGLGAMRHELPPAQDGSPRVLRESLAFKEFEFARGSFDVRIMGQTPGGRSTFRQKLSESSLDDDMARLLHLARLGAFQATLWTRDLDGILVAADPCGDPIGSRHLREAVWGLRLEGDTFLTQFRGLHQIPELLAMQAADLLEKAIRSIRDRSWSCAAESMRAANILGHGVIDSLHPLTDNLTPADYHAIRRHLRGITSGMHSIALHYHLFGDLYDHLAEALEYAFGGEAGLIAAVRELAKRRFSDGESWLKSLVITEALSYRRIILSWRDQHLHLPRMTLGGSGTRSLTGAPDAIAAADTMRRTFWKQDALREVAAGWGLEPLTSIAGINAMDAGQLDSYLLEIVGEIARERFPDVQSRSGPFAVSCPFRPPLPRHL